MSPNQYVPLTCDGQLLHTHSAVLRGLDSNGLFRTAPAQGLCSILAKLAVGQFFDIVPSPPPPPLLQDFVDSVLFKFYVPTDHYMESTQAYGADCSSFTGTYSSLPPLPNGKAAADEEALANAKLASQTAMTMLSALPNGKQCFDKLGFPRVSFTP